MLDGPSLTCPSCGARLSDVDDDLRCLGCGVTFPVEHGIPILVVGDLDTAHDELDHLMGGDGADHKAAQAAHFDRDVAADWEIVRPDAGPRLYRFLLEEKFSRAIAPIGGAIRGATALVVCGGSGMDAALLSRAGASVMTSDISTGAAQRAAERSSRVGISFQSIVADVEHLPFGDAMFDLVYVHDGLHHLEDPMAAIDEMARVARRWVAVSEPAQAAATAVAVQLGLALDREAAGNRVVRLTPDAIVDRLRIHGYRPRLARRYAMYYRHRPGIVFELLSARPIFPLVRSAWKVTNAVLGATIGNKLVVVAERDGVAKAARSRVDELRHA